MKTCAIMQPTYIPWAGYFALINNVDVFVFLDDVQFERRSWQSRNRIVFDGTEKLLTVPVKKTSRDTLIRDIEIDYSSAWNATHYSIFKQAYKNAPFFQDVSIIFEEVLNSKHKNLSQLNVDFIKKCAKYLDIETSFINASDLGCKSKRADHLAEICRAVESKFYFSPIGSKEYLLEDKFESKNEIFLKYFDFYPAEYLQNGSQSFLSHMSIIDVLANLGKDKTKQYITLKVD